MLRHRDVRCRPRRSADPFAADLDRARQNGAGVARHDLAQEPLAFATNLVVEAFRERADQEALPLVRVDGKIALAGRYPRRTERTRWSACGAAAAGGCHALDCC